MNVGFTTKRVVMGVAAVAATIALVAGGVWAYRHNRAMHAALMDLQAQNQADSVFTSTAAAQELADYFDQPMAPRQ